MFNSHILIHSFYGINLRANRKGNFCYFPKNYNMIFLIILYIAGTIMYYSLPEAILFLKCSMKVSCTDFHLKVIEMFIEFLKYLISN